MLKMICTVETPVDAEVVARTLEPGPQVLSEWPSPYTSAVSKKVTPASTAAPIAASDRPSSAASPGGCAAYSTV
jgi:hypothetical protein